MKRMALHPPAVPPATFEFLVLSLRAQAEIQMGLIHFGPPSDKPEPQPALARHAIDMLTLIAGKTKGNLTLDEQRLIDNTLTEMRFHYVRVFGQPAVADSNEAAKG